MHLKNLPGSIVRVGYRIPVPDFYLVLHGLRCRKSTVIDYTKLNQIQAIFLQSCLQYEYMPIIMHKYNIYHYPIHELQYVIEIMYMIAIPHF